MSRERRQSPGRVYAASCQDRPQPLPNRINHQVSHLSPSFLSSSFPFSPVPFEWSNVNVTSDHPTPEGSAGGLSTAAALRKTKTKTKSRLRLPSSLPKKVSSSNPTLVNPFLLPSPAFPPPHRPPNKYHPMSRIPVQTPYPKPPPPLLPGPPLPFFPDGLLQTY